MEHARGIPNATGVHRHVDDLLLDLGGVTGVAVIQQESAPVAYRLLATIALLALAGLPMADDIGPLAMGARSYWIPGSYVTRSSMSAGSNALPRLRTLCTNSKNPRYSGSFSCEIPRCGRSQLRNSDQLQSMDRSLCPPLLQNRACHFHGTRLLSDAP